MEIKLDETTKVEVEVGSFVYDELGDKFRIIDSYCFLRFVPYACYKIVIPWKRTISEPFIISLLQNCMRPIRQG